MKKILLGLGALFVASQIFGDENKESTAGTDSCDAYYNVNGSSICETLLPDMGYVWWNDAPDGDGWYAIAQFENLYQMGAGAFEQGVKALAAATADPSSPQYANAQQVLGSYYITTSGGPLAAA